MRAMTDSPATGTTRSGPAHPGLRWLWLAAAVLVLDQASKQAAVALLEVHGPVELLPVLDLALSFNRGAAFSFLAGAGGWQRWFFTALAIAVGGVIVYWLYRLPPGQRRLGAALGMVLGGAMGNVVDRVWLGHVVDFIDLHYGDWHWPTFNVADSAITIGVVLIILDGFLPDRSGTVNRTGDDQAPGSPPDGD